MIAKHLNDYVPIALFLTIKHKLPLLGQRLLWYDKKLMAQIGSFHPQKLMINEQFMLGLVRAILKHGESEVFEEVTGEVVKWEVMLSETMIDEFMKQGRVHYLASMLKTYNTLNHLKGTNKKET